MPDAPAPPALTAADLALLNAALAHLGEEPLAAFAIDPAPPPRAQRLYVALLQPLLDGLLRDHNWACATRRLLLYPGPSGSDWQYSQFFPLPDDALRVWSLETTAKWQAGWREDVPGVFCSVEDVLLASLVVRVPVAQLDVALFDVLGMLLASRMAGPIKADTDLAAKLKAAAEDAMAAAVAAETSEWGSEPSDSTDLLRAAMGHLGEEAPQDVFAGPSMKAKRAYRALIGPLLDGVLRDHDWACATARATLPPEPPPAGEWRFTNGHAVPDGTLKVRSVETALAWQVGRNGDRITVLCSTSAGLQATLTKRVSIAALDPGLFQALALLLAAHMAGALGATKERMDGLREAADVAMTNAMEADAGEWGSEAAGAADLLRTAVGHLGDSAGGDTFGGVSPRARRAYQAVYATAIDSILRAHPWACATFRAVLPAQPAPADWRYPYAYPTPAGCLRVWDVDTRMRWEVGKVGAAPVVFSSSSAALNAVVILRVPPEQMDATLFDAVALAIAARMAAPLKMSAAMAGQLRAEAKAALDLAIGAETSEWGNEPPAFQSTWLQAREGYGYGLAWNGEGPPPGTVSVPPPSAPFTSTFPLGDYFSSELGATPHAAVPEYDLISHLELGEYFDAELERTP